MLGLILFRTSFNTAKVLPVDSTVKGNESDGMGKQTLPSDFFLWYNSFMGLRRIDLTGKTFRDLEVLRVAGKNRHGAVLWACRCKPCGREITVPAFRLKNGERVN